MSTNWADFAEDDDGEMDLQVELPERSETEIDERGIKKVTYYERKDDGQIMKVTQRVKVIELRQKTPLRTLQRREQWKPFGKAAKGPEDGVTYLSAEEVFMQTPEEDEDEDKNDDFAENLLKQLGTAKIRTNQGMTGPAGSSPGGGEKLGAANPNRYVPPKPQGYVPGSSGIPTRGPDDQAPALRVSNISPEATKDDLFQLFQPFGRIARVYLADPPRGYAFVTYANENDGKRAKEALDGYGYAHLILKVEWAKPSTNRPQSSMRYASGYGKSLPQDNEKSSR